MSQLRWIAAMGALLMSAGTVDAQPTSTSLQHTSTTQFSTTSSSLLAEYENELVLGVFSEEPVASFTVDIQVDGGYGDDDANCQYYGPGSAPTTFHGESTFAFESLPGGELDRSQALMNCSYYTHAPNDALWWDDFFLVKLEARDAQGEIVPAQLCAYQFSWDDLPIPAPGGCRFACGDAVCDGGEPKASDALAVLRVALRLLECSERVCDVDHSGTVNAGDALKVLRRASALPQVLLCAPDSCLGARWIGASTSTTLADTSLAGIPR